MTDREQREWIHAEAAVAATAAVRRWARAATAGFVVLLLGVAAAFYVEGQHNEDRQVSDREARTAIVDSGRATVTVGCNRDFRSIKRLRAIISDQRPRIANFVEEGTLTQAQAERAYADIDANLKRTPLPDCRKAVNAITSDPDKPVVVPEPLYPKG